MLNIFSTRQKMGREMHNFAKKENRDKLKSFFVYICT